MSPHDVTSFDVQPRRGRFASLSSEDRLLGRLRALGFEENVTFRQAMSGLGAWCAETSGRVSLNFSRHSLAPASDEWRRAFDEGDLDPILLRGGVRPASGPPRVQIDAEKLHDLAGALAGRFSAVQDIAQDATSVTLRVESAAFARRLRDGCEILGLRIDQDNDAVRLHVKYAGRLKTVELAFDVVRRVLKLLEAGREVHVDAAPSKPQAHKSNSRVRSAKADEVDVLLPKLLALEAKIFEPARRDPAEKLRIAFDEDDGIASVAEVLRDGEWVLAGFSLAIPLEMVHADGPDQDVFRDACNTLYAVSTTLDPDMHGRGLGLGLKKEVIRAARMMTRPDGTPRYRFLSGRNRTGATGAMQRVNQRLGGYTVANYTNQYGGEGEAIYYRMPVGPIARVPEGDTSGVEKSWLLALEEGRYSGALLRPQAMSAGMLPDTLEALEHFAQRVPGRQSVAAFGSTASALEHIGGGDFCVLGDALPEDASPQIDARHADGFDDVCSNEVLLWRASEGAVIVFGAGSVLGDADEFEVLRAWHTSRAMDSEAKD